MRYFALGVGIVAVLFTIGCFWALPIWVPYVFSGTDVLLRILAAVGSFKLVMATLGTWFYTVVLSLAGIAEGVW